MSQLKVFIMATLAAGLAGCVTPQQATYTYSDGQSVADALAGSSVIGQLSNGQSFCEFHDVNGAILGRDTEIYAGNWELAGDSICYTYPNYGRDCQRGLLVGNRITMMDIGSGAMISKGNIVNGNVCN